jgi:hypothetical protein
MPLCWKKKLTEMKSIQFILFLVFISGSSILMINSGRINPQIEQQHNSYWTVIANAMTEAASISEAPEPEQFSSSVSTVSTRSTVRSDGTGIGTGTERRNNTNRNNITGNMNLSQNETLNLLHSRIIQSTLQPIDLTISPREAANYAARLDTKMHYITK